MAKQKSKELRIVGRVLLALTLLLFVTALFKLYEDLLSDNVYDEKVQPVLYVYSNTSFDNNFERIKSQHVLKESASLKRLLTFSGYEDMLKPGRYRLKQGMNNLELMRMLVAGRQEPVDITFKYAVRKHDLAVFWSKYLEADSNSIEEMLNGKVITDSLGLSGDNKVLAFIPNTYNFYWNTSARELTLRMIDEYRHFWDSGRVTKAKAIGLTQAEIGILASIVQKETNMKDEMPVVAGVYFNRLKKGMRLQADPTILYVLNNPEVKRVAGEMLKLETPYNTYLYSGLPPGPICVPSIHAIDAVLNLQRHTYLYFCAREDFSGYHRFSSTFTQHQQYARNYQRALNKRGIK